MPDDLVTRLQTEADQCRNDGADDIARLLDEAAAALVPSPAEGYEDSTLQQAEAWEAVCDALHEVSPGWHKNGYTGLAAAVATIRSLANVQPKGTQPVELPAGLSRSDAEFWLRKRGEIIDALRAEGLTMVTTLNGERVMRLGKIEAQSATQAPAPAHSAVELLARVVAALDGKRAANEAGEPGFEFNDALWAVLEPARAVIASPAVAHPAWQPIKTAPKDGTHILVWTDVSDTAYVVCWADASKGIRKYLTAESGAERGWHLAWDGELFDREHEPTHWMPLPAAPLLAGTPHHEGGGGGAVKDWSDKTPAANSSPTPTGGEGRGVEVSGLAAEGSQDAGATAETPWAGKVDSSGLTAEGLEPAALTATPGEQLDDAPVPEPANCHFARMLQHLGRNPA